MLSISVTAFLDLTSFLSYPTNHSSHRAHLDRFKGVEKESLELIRGGTSSYCKRQVTDIAVAIFGKHSLSQIIHSIHFFTAFVCFRAYPEIKMCTDITV